MLRSCTVPPAGSTQPPHQKGATLASGHAIKTGSAPRCCIPASFLKRSAVVIFTPPLWASRLFGTGGTHMIKTFKLHKFWSNYGEDTLLVSGIIILVLALYLLAAYVFLTF